MGVSAESEAGVEVAEDAGEGLYVYAVLQGKCGEGMAKIVEADVWESC